ncbi:epithelial-stromal interaction protein 1 [Mantella aurantiaca]
MAGWEDIYFVDKQHTPLRNMYGQNSGFGTGTPRQSQSGPHSRPPSRRDFSTGSMGDQQDQYQDADQEINNPTQESTPQVSQEPQYNGCYVVVPPNQTKRDKLLTMANKELEEYNRFLESRRSGPIHLTPKKLGGQTSEEKARQQQQLTQSQSKYQKKFQRDEYKRRQKDEEEAKVQQMKDAQRKKAEKLEQKRHQENIERRERWDKHMLEKRSEFLDQFSQPSNSSSSNNSYGTIPSEQDEEMIFQLALKESMKTKNEEDQRRENLEKNQPWQASQNCYKQELQEEEEGKWQQMKEEHCRKKMDEERRRQELVKTEPWEASRSYKQQLKEEEERKLKEMKEVQRRKSELLEVKKAEEEKERKLSQQEQHRRVNKAFLDKLQRQQEYSGDSNTWA